MSVKLKSLKEVSTASATKSTAKPVFAELDDSDYRTRSLVRTAVLMTDSPTSDNLRILINQINAQADTQRALCFTISNLIYALLETVTSSFDILCILKKAQTESGQRICQNVADDVMMRAIRRARNWMLIENRG